MTSLQDKIDKQFRFPRGTYEKTAKAEVNKAIQELREEIIFQRNMHENKETIATFNFVLALIGENRC